MCDVVKDIRQTNVDIGISIDASWQRRGYSSLNGVTTAISVDTENIRHSPTKTKYCNSCASKETLRSHLVQCLKKLIRYVTSVVMVPRVQWNAKVQRSCFNILLQNTSCDIPSYLEMGSQKVIQQLLTHTLASRSKIRNASGMFKNVSGIASEN